MRSLPLATPWQILPPAAILFQAGISGAWWAAQFHAPLPAAWGWFGAILIGVSAWSGVHLAVAGQRRGWLLAAVAVGIDAIMAAAYFGANHPPLLAIPLALAPALITILAAWQAARQIAEAQRPQADALAWEQDQAARDREAARRRLERDAEAQRKAQLLEAKALADVVRQQAAHPEQAVQPVPNIHPDAPDARSAVSDADTRILDTLLGSTLSIRQAAARLDIAPSTLHDRVHRLGLTKNGNGWKKL